MSSSSSSSSSCKILMLVLASKDPCGGGPYMDMIAITRAYYATIPDLDVVYYMYDPDQAEAALRKGDVLSFRGTESLVPGCLAKTLAALQYFEKDLDAYRYVLRPNASSIVDVARFRQIIDAGPVAVAYGGCQGWTMYPTWRDPKSGIVDGRYGGVTFGAGSCIILTPDTVRFLLATHAAGDMDMGVVDDVAIGKAMQLLPHVRCSFFWKHSWDVPDFKGDDVALAAAVATRQATCVLYRNKNTDRTTDVCQMQAIIHALTNAADPKATP
jgi:hypothetical protein